MRKSLASASLEALAKLYIVSFVHLWDNLSNKNNKDRQMGDLKMKKHVIVGCLLIVSSMFVSACGNSSDVTTEKPVSQNKSKLQDKAHPLL